MAKTEREQLEQDIEMLQCEIRERENAIDIARRAIEDIDSQEGI